MKINHGIPAQLFECRNDGNGKAADPAAVSCLYEASLLTF